MKRYSSDNTSIHIHRYFLEASSAQYAHLRHRRRSTSSHLFQRSRFAFGSCREGADGSSSPVRSLRRMWIMGYIENQARHVLGGKGDLKGPASLTSKMTGRERSAFHYPNFMLLSMTPVMNEIMHQYPRMSCWYLSRFPVHKDDNTIIEQWGELWCQGRGYLS